jgi:hypothetical protein
MVYTLKSLDNIRNETIFKFKKFESLSIVAKYKNFEGKI